MSARREALHPALLASLAAAGVFVALVMLGWDYYRLPAIDRLHHPRHAQLRSSGEIGLACGLAGTALFLLNLTYLVRKRFVGLAWAGSLRGWMAMHVVSGLTGTGLIVLHCSFLPRSSLGTLALAGLAVVVTTGLIGRYIHGAVPRSAGGRELRRDELRRRLALHRETLAAQGIGAGLLGPVEPDAAIEVRSLLARLMGVVAGNRQVRRDYRRFRAAVHDRGDLGRIAHQFYRDQQRLSRFDDLRSLMAAWRFLHRWLAILMLILAGAHIAIAVLYGDLWGGG